MNATRRIPAMFKPWFHVIETELPKGKSTVLATLCTRQSAENFVNSLKTVSQKSKKVYTIDPTPTTNPMRRCDHCKCKGM